MYDLVAIIAGMLIICIFIYVVITDGWKIFNYIIKKYFLK